MSSTPVILLLCVSPLLAAGSDCADSVVSAEVKQQIIQFHNQRRGRFPVFWDCALEGEARITTGPSTHNTGRGVNVIKIDKQKDDKASVNKALEQWLSDPKAISNIENKHNKKIGCSHQDRSGKFALVCVYAVPPPS
ncbi:SCP-like protein [Ancylostoma caninum]|uniref:SCP-like protein n=1 Tax=Ancylostoma caninum TaxID=29170 RepID=A0A368GDL4_ANCCA|nr:SCP-like protein [Ancylostoma caninum]